MGETNALAPVPSGRAQIIRTMSDAERAAAAMARSGYFQDSREAAQALVKILAGQEMGFGAFASMTGIYIIQGRPSVGANLMAAAVKGSGKYDYRVAQMTPEVCEIVFYQGGQEIGRSKFTAQEARQAGVKNMDKFPRNMLFARAMSNGVRWYCPDVFNGSPVYTPEELGAQVNEDGEVVDAVSRPVDEKPSNWQQVEDQVGEPPSMVDAGIELGGVPKTTPPGKKPTRAQLLNRLHELMAKLPAGTDLEPFDEETATDAEIIERGKLVKALLEA